MIANRPLIYLTLPSLALIIGYVWLRRKKGGKAVCDSGGGEVEPTHRSFSLDDKNCKLVDSSEFNDQLEVSAHYNSQHSESLPIGKSSQQHNRSDSQSSSLSDQEQQKSQSPSSAGSSSSISKSAPIDIAPNPRSPPKRVTEQDVDSEILKLIPQESDIKNLRYIEEIDWNESPTPADSPLYRDRYDLNRGQPKVEPTVYVRGTQEAKISPENSFRERKYTQTESDEYETAEASGSSNMTEVVENIVSTTTKSNTNTALTDSGCDAEVADVKSTAAAVACIAPQISSPALSLCSMRSGDSGQGSSPPQSICSPHISYEFLIPIQHIGALIGPGGRIITDIKEKTGANVIIRKSSHNGSKKQKICSVEGTQSEVDAALKLIRVKLPEKRYPNMTMERVFVTPDNRVALMSALNTSTLNVSVVLGSSCTRCACFEKNFILIMNFSFLFAQLQLVEQINNDVIVSTVVDGRLFLQQPVHPTFPVLSALQNNMNQWYSYTAAPELPEVIENAICAVCVQDSWYRVQILASDRQAKTCHVKYLDFGGYSTVSWAELKQIHANFMTLPFQAIECVLSNIQPLNGGEWPKELAETVLNLTQGVIVQVRIALIIVNIEF